MHFLISPMKSNTLDVISWNDSNSIPGISPPDILSMMKKSFAALANWTQIRSNSCMYAKHKCGMACSCFFAQVDTDDSIMNVTNLMKSW